MKHRAARRGTRVKNRKDDHTSNLEGLDQTDQDHDVPEDAREGTNSRAHASLDPGMADYAIRADELFADAPDWL